jgi:hypothetical protein
MYEITFIDTGRTVRWTDKRAATLFGRVEWLEIKQGYAPHIVAVKIC